jgi:hypothetical protein
MHSMLQNHYDSLLENHKILQEQQHSLLSNTPSPNNQFSMPPPMLGPTPFSDLINDQPSINGVSAMHNSRCSNSQTPFVYTLREQFITLFHQLSQVSHISQLRINPEMIKLIMAYLTMRPGNSAADIETINRMGKRLATDKVVLQSAVYALLASRSSPLNAPSMNLKQMNSVPASSSLPVHPTTVDNVLQQQGPRNAVPQYDTSLNHTNHFERSRISNSLTATPSQSTPAYSNPSNISLTHIHPLPIQPSSSNIPTSSPAPAIVPNQQYNRFVQNYFPLNSDR